MSAIPGVPSTIQPIPDHYHGLNYSAAFGYGEAGTVVAPGPSYAGFSPQSIVLHNTPPSIAADCAVSRTESYRLVSFNWFPVVNIGNPGVVVTLNATLTLNGTTDAGRAVEASCAYVAPPLPVGAAPVTSIPLEQCTLPASFDRLLDVQFTVTQPPVLDANTGIGIANTTYVLHRYC